MNTCKYELCSNEAQGSSAYCSNSCRAQQSRRNKTSATSEAQHPTPDQIQAAAAVGRDCTPMKPPCTAKQLTSPCHACTEQGSCDYLANQTTALPGDAEYAGVV